jgi:hypothetical protein
MMMMMMMMERREKIPFSAVFCFVYFSHVFYYTTYPIRITGDLISSNDRTTEHKIQSNKLKQ